MSMYDQLPVYKSSYDLLLQIFEQKKQFPRDFRYTVGERLSSEGMELIIHIFKANRIEAKGEFLLKARENIEVIRLLFRLMKDLKQISLKRFIAINEKIEEVSRQLAGWMKTVR